MEAGSTLTLTDSSETFQACVRRRAVISVTANPACPDAAAAERAVNEVWDSCFNDTRPFDEVGNGIRSFLTHAGSTSDRRILWQIY